MIVTKPLWGQDMWKDTWVCLQGAAAILTVFHILAYKVLTLPGNREADALGRVPVVTT